MRRIYWIRHALPEFPGGIPVCMGSRLDFPISETGREQAHELGRHFLLPITTIFCSPMLRCRQTAEIFSQYTQVPIIIRPNLVEMDGGVWDGLTLKEMHEKYPECFETGDRTPPGGEGTAEGQKRILTELNEICACSTGDIAIVSHASIGRLLLTSLRGMPLSERFSIPLEYTSVSLLEENCGQVHVEQISLSSHEMTAILQKEGKA